MQQITPLGFNWRIHERIHETINKVNYKDARLFKLSRTKRQRNFHKISTDVIRAETMTCQSMQQLLLQDIFAYGNQMMTEMDMPQSLRSSLAKDRKKQPRSCVSDRLSSSLMIVCCVSCATSAKLDTRKRQLVTRPGLPRQRCCVCHLHHKCAMNSPAAVRDSFHNSACVPLQG